MYLRRFCRNLPNCLSMKYLWMMDHEAHILYLYTNTCIHSLAIQHPIILHIVSLRHTGKCGTCENDPELHSRFPPHSHYQSLTPH